MANITWAQNELGQWFGVASGLNGNFNLHLEKTLPGAVTLSVKTSGNAYAPVHTFGDPAIVVDADFSGEVFPKDVLILCSGRGGSQPTATITEAE